MFGHYMKKGRLIFTCNLKYLESIYDLLNKIKRLVNSNLCLTNRKLITAIIKLTLDKNKTTIE